FREAGALATLPAALNAMAVVLVYAGEFSRAAEMLAEEDAIAKATGTPQRPNARFVLAAWRGRQPEALRIYATALEDATRRGEGATIGSSQVTLACLHNGRGNYDDAHAAAGHAYESDEFSYSSVALHELTEAAVRAGQPERAAVA